MLLSKKAWFAGLLMVAGVCSAQVGAVDPARAETKSRVVGDFHTPLPEEYVWTADDAAVVTKPNDANQVKSDTWKVEPHYFRSTFTVSMPPKDATVYVAGVRKADLYVNGKLVSNLSGASGSHMAFHMLSADVRGLL